MEVSSLDRPRDALCAGLTPLRYAQQVEKELHSELKSKERLPRFEDIDSLIKE